MLKERVDPRVLVLTEEQHKTLSPGQKLIAERDAWKALYEQGKIPWAPWLQEYRENRNSKYWRSTRAAEEVCEYILYLEAKVEELEKEVKELDQCIDYDPPGRNQW